MKSIRPLYNFTGFPETSNLLAYATPYLLPRALREVRKIMYGDTVLDGHSTHFDAMYGSTWNVEKTEKGKEFSLALPGVAPDRISVETSDKHVEVRVSAENGEDDSNYDVRRRLYRFKLDSNADSDAITAKAEHGVLKITVPLKESEPKREITVEVAN